MTKRSTSKTFVYGCLAASVIMTTGVAPAVAQEARGAAAQSRAERIAERRASIEQRLQSLQSNRAERMARRTEVFQRMAATTPETVEARLSATEERILTALDQADPDWIAQSLNERGEKATEVLTSRDFARLTDEQLDALISAAGRAALITPEEVEAMIAVGSFKVSDFFDTTDPEQIAAKLNEFGEKALELQGKAKTNN